MSRLDELIQQYCPDGVAYVALETVCLISKGIQFNKKDMHDEGTFAHYQKGEVARERRIGKTETQTVCCGAQADRSQAQGEAVAERIETPDQR